VLTVLYNSIIGHRPAKTFVRLEENIFRAIPNNNTLAGVRPLRSSNVFIDSRRTGEFIFGRDVLVGNRSAGSFFGTRPRNTIFNLFRFDDVRWVQRARQISRLQSSYIRRLRSSVSDLPCGFDEQTRWYIENVILAYFR